MIKSTEETRSNALVNAQPLNNWQLNTVKKISQHVHQTRSATERKAGSSRPKSACPTQTSRMLWSLFVPTQNWFRTKCSDLIIRPVACKFTGPKSHGIPRLRHCQRSISRFKSHQKLKTIVELRKRADDLEQQPQGPMDKAVLENVAIANALQLEAARRLASPYPL